MKCYVSTPSLIQDYSLTNRIQTCKVFGIMQFYIVKLYKARIKIYLSFGIYVSFCHSLKCRIYNSINHFANNQQNMVLFKNMVGKTLVMFVFMFVWHVKMVLDLLECCLSHSTYGFKI